MTLTQWAEKYGRLIIDPMVPNSHHGCMVVSCLPHEQRDLYHLDDYTVSSVSGGALWLIPVEKDNPLAMAVDYVANNICDKDIKEIVSSLKHTTLTEENERVVIRHYQTTPLRMTPVGWALVLLCEYSIMHDGPLKGATLDNVVSLIELHKQQNS